MELGAPRSQQTEVKPVVAQPTADSALCVMCGKPEVRACVGVVQCAHCVLSRVHVLCLCVGFCASVCGVCNAMCVVY